MFSVMLLADMNYHLEATSQKYPALLPVPITISWIFNEIRFMGFPIILLKHRQKTVNKPTYQPTINDEIIVFAARWR